MTDKNRLYTGAAIGTVAAAALGFGAARLTQSSTPPLPLRKPQRQQSRRTRSR